MKISLSTAQKLLEELMLDVEVVAENDDTGVDVEELATQAKESLKPSILEAAKADVEADVTGRFLGSLRSAVQRAMNIPRKEMEGKTLQEIIAMAKESTETKGGEVVNEWQAKYNALLQESENEKETLNTTWQTKYDADISAANKRYADRDINDALVSLVNKMPRSGGDPVKQAKVLRNLAEDAGIAISFDEAKKALNFVRDGKPVKVEDTLNELAADVLPLAKNTSHINPSQAGQHQAGIVQTNNGANGMEGIPAGDAVADLYNSL